MLLEGIGHYWRACKRRYHKARSLVCTGGQDNTTDLEAVQCRPRTFCSCRRSIAKSFYQFSIMVGIILVIMIPTRLLKILNNDRVITKMILKMKNGLDTNRMGVDTGQLLEALH